MSLDKNRIESLLGDLSNKLSIFVYNSTDSTNTRAKEAALGESVQYAVFMANGQTAGRGRMGRSFVSDENKGLYLSILVKDGSEVRNALRVTTYMAVIASRAIEAHANINTGIKWVNDIYCNGKKLAGILTEGQMNPSGRMDYYVCGIGINLMKQSFPEEIKDIATTVEDECGKRVDVNELAGTIITEFFSGLNKLTDKSVTDEYISRSILLDKDVTVIKPTEEYFATVTGITDRCELILRLRSGEEEILSSGEVSIRQIN